MKLRSGFFDRALWFALSFLASWVAEAHHAATEYDFEKVTEIEGTLIEVKWQNPHVRVKVRAAQPSSAPLVWEIEGAAISILRRTNVSSSDLRVGERVRVAGHASRRSTSRMFGKNLLRPDGTELLFHPDSKPRWRATALGNDSAWYSKDKLEVSQAGIFRVWSSHLDDFFLMPDREPSLNAAAREIVARWDHIHQSVARDCEPVGMPLIMDQPYPMEIAKAGDRLLLRFEANDVVRTVYMRAQDRPLAHKSIHGRSTGRWEGETLIVETDGVTWPYLDHAGAPLSERARFTEKFTPTIDGTRLQYVIVIEDQTYLTQPLTMRREWLARPNEKVVPYDCAKSP